jgi:intermediate filament protein if
MESSYKTTTYETRTSTTTDADAPIGAYRTSIAPRSVVIQRTSYGGVGSAGGRSGGGGYSRERSVQYSMTGGPPAGSYAVMSSTGVSNVKQTREQEKKDMQDLNERFASYIEKVRFLEAQNKRLADELEKLKSKWGKETTAIKAMFQAELDEARKLLDDADKEKARLEIRVASLEEQLEEHRQRLNEANRYLAEERERVERMIQQLSDYEAEVNLMRRRVECLESDRDKDKKTIITLRDQLNRTRADLDNETLLHIDAENRRQTLEEELEFLKAVHEQEMKELAALAYRDTTSENREFWKNEMGQCLREIQQVYDEKMDAMRGELETFYNLKVQEFRTGAAKQNMESVHSKEESKRLKTQMVELRDKLNDLEARNNQLQRELDILRREKEDRERELEAENSDFKMEISKLRAEMEAILKELQGIMDSKLGLELEIAAYRKLLEGEENRDGLRQIVDKLASGSDIQQSRVRQEYSSFSGSAASQAAGGVDSATRVTQVVKGEMSAKTTYQRSAKGPVAIAECSADGKFITLENTGRKEEDLSGWRIKRNIDGLDKSDFAFGQLVLQPISKIRIWAKENRPSSAPYTDLEYHEGSWGVGSSILTKLVSNSGEDRASHIQKTTYS